MTYRSGAELDRGRAGGSGRDQFLRDDHQHGGGRLLWRLPGHRPGGDRGRASRAGGGASRARPVGAENSVTLCDLGIFVDQTPEPVPPQDPNIGAQSGRMLASGGRAPAERPVQAMNVVMIDVFAQDQPQVPLAGDQHPIQTLAPGAGNPPLRDRVRPRRPDRRLDDPHAEAVSTASNAAVNLASRSRIKNFRPSARSPRLISRLRACWATHSPVG